MGARSPQAPTDPFTQTCGVTPLLSIATRVSVISSLQPECPCAWTFARSSIAART